MEAGLARLKGEKDRPGHRDIGQVMGELIQPEAGPEHVLGRRQPGRAGHAVLGPVDMIVDQRFCDEQRRVKHRREAKEHHCASDDMLARVDQAGRMPVPALVRRLPVRLENKVADEMLDQQAAHQDEHLKRSEQSGVARRVGRK